MVDYKLPKPENEFVSSAKHVYPKIIAVHVKDFTNKLKLAHTLQALESLKRDILRSDLTANFQAKEELRGVANMRAKELGFKAPSRGEWWT